MEYGSNNTDDEAVYQNAAQICIAIAFYWALVLVSTTGCVSTPSNQAGGVSETSGHALAQALVNEDAQVSSYSPLISVTWPNDTTAHEHFVRNDVSDIMTTDITYSAFPSVTAASAYFDSLRSQYPIKPEATPHDINLKLVTGQTPTVYKALTTTDMNLYLTQEDTVVMQLSFQHQSVNQA
jgi:hypothetical protein